MNYTRFTNLKAEVADFGTVVADEIIADEVDIPSELPEYSATDSGKVLSVGPDGKLKWIALE